MAARSKTTGARGVCTALLLLLATALAGPRPALAVEKASEQVSTFYGSFSRAIPIEVPGFRGLEPMMALSYSSEGRNGFVGVGWSVSGFTTLQRVNAGLGSPKFDSADVFLLDGQELVPCQAGSASPSCTSGGTHAAKIEGYLKIKFEPGPNTWSIWSKDGTKTVLSPIITVPGNALVPGGTLRWGVSSRVDTDGNTVTYAWTCLDNECYPLAAGYNGYQVAFFKEARPDWLSFAAATVLGETRYRLRSIIVWAPSAPAHIRGYKLTYQASPLTGRSLLASVQQYGKDLVHDGAGLMTGGTTLPAQTFTYQDDTLGRTFVDWGAPPIGCQARLYTGDFNGDGRTDQLCYQTAGTVTASVSLSSANGLTAPTVWSSGTPFSDPAFADFNNDGKTDVATHDPWTGEFFVALSTGSSFGAFTSWGTAGGTLPGGAAAACRVNPATVGSGDFNGDGLTDVFCNLAGSNVQFIGLSTGTAFAFSVFSQYACDSVADARVGALDFDGDGKDDWYCIGAENNNMYVFPSTGSMFLWPAYGSLSAGFCTADRYVLGDFNADGRTDAACVGNGKVALSVGRSFLEVGTFGGWCGGGLAMALDVDGDGASEIVCDNPGAGATDIQVRRWRGAGQTPALGAAETWKANWCSGTVDAGDWNGDGKVDLYCRPTARPAVAGTGGLTADLLGGAGNGMGGTLQLTYVPSTSFPQTNNPPVKQVISTLTEGAGLGGVHTTTFSYAGGLMDRKERRFLGFRYARTNLPCIAGESTCPYTETWFSQALAAAGSPEKVIRRGGAGNILDQKVFTYQTNGATIPRTALLSGETTYAYDGDGCPISPCAQEKITQVTHQYDAYGNRTLSSWGGDADLATDNRSTAWDFVANTSAYIVGLVGRERHFDHAGAQTAATQFTYDRQGQSAAWTQAPTKGHLTHSESWLDVGNRWLATTYGYDPYGNQTRITDPTGVSITTTFDSARHVFPETVTNVALPAEPETTLWDPVCGVPTQRTDANAQVTTFQSDALCRKTRTDMPLGGFEIVSYRDFGTPNMQRVVVETPPATPGANQFLATHTDGLGRPWRTVASGPTAGVAIVTDTGYNERGQVASRTAPFYSNETPFTTLYSYDALDRPTRTQHPDGNAVGKEYGLRSETTTDENGRPTTLRFDAYGRTVVEERVLSGTVVATQLGYDSLGQRTSAVDHLGNTWTWQFDSLGRNTLRADPDAGTITYTFDDNDRVKQQTDALGQRLQFDYDAAGRKSQKRTYNASNTLTGTVTLLYGEPRPPYLNTGRLTSVNGPGAVGLTMDYDARGRMARQRRGIDGVEYTASKSYDAQGRTLNVGYPDETIGPLGYDAAGRVRSVPGIVNDAAYDAAGRPTLQVNANGTTTQRTYTPGRGFLAAITTSGATTLQNMTYAPDATGRASGVSSPNYGESWTYTYDDLYRLTSATSPDPRLTQTWTYDEIGRITSNSRLGAYGYPAPGQPRPHAPLTAGTRSYSYDAAGNMSVGGGRTFTWSVEGQPTAVNTTQYAYDGGGVRVKKTVAGVTTVYPFGDDYEVTGGVSTKYISVAGLGLVAKRSGGQTSWLHTDRLGSIQVVSDAAGAERLRRSYRPYGEKIQDSTSFAE